MSARDWPALAGGVIVALLGGLALLALVWTPHDPAALDIAHRLARPSASHPLGTDQLGRDLLSMLMAGGLPAFLTATLAVAIGAGVGVPLGLAAAALGGWIDEAVMRLADILFAFPAVLMAMLIVAVWGPGPGKAALAIGLFTIPVFARVARGGARSLWPRDYVAAARLAGKGRLGISVEHILPNIAGQLLVQATIQFAIGLVAESALSYLGLGAQPPVPSWGRMLADGQTLIAIAPGLVILPGLALLLAVTGVNLIGAGLARRIACG